MANRMWFNTFCIFGHCYEKLLSVQLDGPTLDDLNYKLAMPIGCKFTTRVLADELRLGGLGSAVVINDNFGCTYLKV
jgi:hypothetical protein